MTGRWCFRALVGYISAHLTLRPALASLPASARLIGTMSTERTVAIKSSGGIR